ncbi:protein kinase [Streptomyces sp. NBC_01571]|uniref:serine/threonine protein kinase n=1 Tax=Streptomyces sp. NBC_01571 TaxID=2975883 RepID=UPI00225437A4|nr:protein kinase [Streptomyces sp. NBC_01571]MCX4581174.1 protein kinase [Streptomyces sp. NBC_01571]
MRTEGTVGMVGGRNWKPQEGARLGKWTLVGRGYLGRGGNGEVWEARREGDDGRYAIKMFGLGRSLKNRRQRFADEITFLRGYTGEGVVPLVDSHVPEDPREICWYVMPLAVPLDEALGDTPAEETMLEAIAGYAETLATLAEQGVHHRDIKPSNLFARDGQWEIGDFGLVTFPGKSDVTSSAVKLGPANFHAPEMLEPGEKADGGPADVWSLAKTMWVLLRRTRWPLPGEYRAGGEYSLQGHIALPWAGELDRLMQRCTALTPEARPTMADFAKEVRACLAEPPELRDAASIAEMQDRLAALTAASHAAAELALERRDSLERIAVELNDLCMDLWGVVDGMLRSRFLFYESQPEPSDATRLLPMVMRPWAHPRGALFTSPDQNGKAAVKFSFVVRVVDEPSDEAEIAFDLRVVHRHQGLEDYPFNRQRTWNVPLGSVQFARVLGEIRSIASDAVPDMLPLILRIVALADDHVPDWYVNARPGDV